MQKGVGSPAVLIAGLILALAGIGTSLAQRYKVETENRAVTLAVEYDTVEAFSAAQGLTVKEGLDNLKLQGLTSVVLAEETIGELVSKGQVQVEVQTFGDKALAPVPTLVCHDQTSVDRVSQGLRIRFPKRIGTLNTRGNVLMLPDLDTNLVRAVAVGLNPTQARNVRDAGLGIIARASNPVGASTDTVQNTVQWLRTLGATVFLPQGDQVLGRRDALRSLVESLEKSEMLYASPEFAKLGGDANVLQLAPERVVRLHAAQAAELDKLPIADAVERYTKAARERGMRILLLRPISNTNDAPLSGLADFVRQVNEGVTHDGGGMGVARPYEAAVVPTWAFALIAFGSGLVVLQAFAPLLEDRRWLALSLLVLLGFTAGAVLRTPRELVALGLSVLLPIAGFMALERARPKESILGVLLVSGYSLLSGLCVASLLNGLAYTIRADQFPGVKMAVFLPIAAVGLYYFFKLTDFRSSLASPITWGTAALSFIVLGAIGFMLVRTGNDAPSGVSDTELKFRGLLDAILFVRPRTKEFLIGHPALVIGVSLLTLLRKPDISDQKRAVIGGWSCLALMLGAMGQTSIVNTMCHLHTPLVLSLARIGIGLVFGCIMGFAIWAVTGRRISKVGG